MGDLGWLHFKGRVALPLDIMEDCDTSLLAMNAQNQG